ncbi:MAG: efflux RND transporter permease subunit, partial [candidate division Zixibacteria bacterium]|nr:efflux RND transporter permease subunit [candidate division Zixibacteria bacterium]
GESAAVSASDRVPIYLRDVAAVRYILSEPENIVRVNGRRCVGLEIFKERKANTIDAVNTARKALQRLGSSLPGYELEVIYDQGRFIAAAVTEVGEAAIIGVILAMLVLFAFLRRLGTTAVISLAIPVSVVATFNLMYFNNLTLNIMTLGGLALGAGMLVDNAIVVMENIFRHLEEGKKIREAAILGAGQVGGAITSATLTTIVVFLPIVYLHGAAGELFREQAWTVAFALVSSLFVALLVMPMLSVKLLKTTRQIKTRTAISFPRYRRFLGKVLDRRWSVVGAGLLLIIATCLLLPLVGGEFIPRSDQGEFYINIALPEGSSLERTAGAVANIESIIDQQIGTEVQAVYSRIGPGGDLAESETDLEDENNAVIHLILKRDRRAATPELIDRLNRQLADIPDLRIEFVQQQTALQQTLGTAAAPLVVEIKGKDLDVLSRLADSVQARLQTIPDLANIETGFRRGRPEVDIVIDPQIAGRYSLTVDQIARQLSDQLGGRQAGELKYQGEYSDITIRHPRVSLTELDRLLLETASGLRVPLMEVADIDYTYATREITHTNQSRVGKVTAQLATDQSFDKVVARVKAALATLQVPAEYSYAVTGEEEKRSEALGNLKFALLLAVILVYMVMASQFESLLHPLVIILTLPLAGVGAVLALLALGISFNVMSLIGIIMLAGIAVNDSIILVDCINQLRRAGHGPREAVIIAGQMRIRPIVMTSITTVLALLPLTIGLGEGVALRAPLAVAVIGGLVTATLLTLVVIPAVYYLLAGKVGTASPVQTDN